MASSDDEGLPSGLFEEPAGYLQPEKPASQAEYMLISGQILTVRLVGHSPLWGHYLWNGAQVISKYLQQNIARLVKGKNVLELGAGAGLPSLVAGVLGAKMVVVTDYPDADLIDNIVHNISTCAILSQPATNIVAEGYLWGSSSKPLISHLSSPEHGFDTLILADLLFNHSCHTALVSTICDTLARTPSSTALIFFTPYRPWLLNEDMAFFELCRGRGLKVEKMLEESMEKVMFEEDRGDEKLRRTVFGFEVQWINLGEVNEKEG